MTEPDQKFEEEIRRALCAASDLIVPAGDGLNKIRERTSRRPPALGWLLAYAINLPRQLARGGRVAASEVAATAHGNSSLGPVLASARRWPGQARHILRTPSIWLRPALATATAVVLVLGVMLSIPRVRNQLSAQLDSALGNSSNPGPGGGSNAGGSGGAQSSVAAPMPTGTATYMAGKPFLATMAPGSAQCRSQGSGGTSGTATTRHSSGTGYIPPSVGPGPSQTVGAGMNGGVAHSVGSAPLNVATPGDMGPEPVSVTCSPSTAPTKRATSPPVTQLATTPVTSPPTTPVTSPPTTPVTTPPTTATTTTPPTTPPTTPTTTPPTQTNTSSTNNTASTGTPAASAAPSG